MAGAGLLHLLPVDRAAELQVVGVLELVGGDQPRPRRPEPGKRLAQRELRHRPGQLDRPLGQILAHHQARDVGPGLVLRHPFRGPADHRDQLDLPVHPVAGQLDGGVRTGQAAAELGEHRRHVRCVHTGLGGVLPVVQADPEHLRRGQHRRAKLVGH